MKFNETMLREEILHAITEMGYETMTPIQEQSLPLLMEGHDIIGQSQTGTGKTAAFMLPILQSVSPRKDRQVQALILCPTRELALQVAGEARKFAQYMDQVRIVPIYGGDPIHRQIIDLKKGQDIVVGTPGRILDHLRRHTLKVSNCKTLVLDEADEMLNMGFIEEITEIISHLPQARQTALFSATMPQPIIELSRQFQNDPQTVRIHATSLTVDRIEQQYYEVSQHDKTALLIQLLTMHHSPTAMIFCNTKKMVDDLTASLNKAGFGAAAIHGDMKQEMRQAVMERFKAGQLSLLVATDVAARGIDVPDMDLVINYDLPQENEFYVHRIGRTGRAGRKGLAISLVTPRQREVVRQLQRITRDAMVREELPDAAQLNDLATDLLLRRLHKAAADDTRIEDFIEACAQQGYDEYELLRAMIADQLDAYKLTPISKPFSPKARSNAPMATIALNIGTRQEITPAHIVSAIAQAARIQGKDIGKIKIQERTTLVDIPASMVRKVSDALATTTIRGKTVVVSPVRQRRKSDFRK